MKLTCSFLCFLAALFSGFMSIRYITYIKRAKTLPNRGEGMVISVKEDHGFDASFARAGSGSAGTKEPGIGGIWQIVFMLWNEIRPDCWYPVVLYNEDDGKIESATLLYGSFKNTWKIGEIVELSWDEKKKMIVYPLNKKWLSKKIYFYLIFTCILLGISILFAMI